MTNSSPLPTEGTAFTSMTGTPQDVDKLETSEASQQHGLWLGDTGSLAEPSRRALLKLVQGPYLSSKQHPRLWTAILADRDQIQARLHDLFLDLVVDEVDEFAFTRKPHTPEFDVPSALRNVSLTYADTIMLLVLRQQLLATGGGQRTIVSRQEIFEQLAIYRNTDEATFERNLNSSWGRMSNQYRVLHTVTEDRVEVSPIVKFLIDENRVRSLTQVYQNLAGTDAKGDTASDPDQNPAAERPVTPEPTGTPESSSDTKGETLP